MPAAFAGIPRSASTPDMDPADHEAAGMPSPPDERSVYRQLLSGAVQYSISSVLARSVTFLAVPIYLHFLTSRQFAIQAIALLNEQILLIIAGYAITNALGKHY